MPAQISARALASDVFANSDQGSSGFPKAPVAVFQPLVCSSSRDIDAILVPPPPRTPSAECIEPTDLPPSDLPRLRLGQERIWKLDALAHHRSKSKEELVMNAVSFSKSRDFSDSLMESTEQSLCTLVLPVKSRSKSMEKLLLAQKDLEDHACMESDSSNVLKIMFEVRGEDRLVQIRRRPLGAEFSKKRNGPIKVSNVHEGSHAAELGLHAGWIIRSINGKDVSSWSFETTQEALRCALMGLPCCQSGRGACIDHW
jgi:hypothetical protein